ncbi:Family c-likeg-protein-coupled receptor protein [Madurella fahalii]|uniref:Family c-likeg-protein-coupled receptor protein n=1 Tax=Madurella fahalii TaxID=1157608 RepID=A0ABQ0GPR6_9PEZI
MSSNSPPAGGAQAPGSTPPGTPPGFPPLGAGGPPYPPPTAQLGGQPTTIPDVPVSAVLLFLFAAAAATHMTIYQRNRRVHGRKFVFSLLVFGFCMARIAALALRIAWSVPRNRANVDLAIASGVFVSAGVLLLFVVNLVLALRVLRATHPRTGWGNPLRWLWRAVLASVVAVLVMVVVCSVHSLFTLDAEARMKERDVMRFAGVYLTVIAFLPVVVVVAAAVLPRRGAYPPEEFGEGTMRTKMALLLFTSVVLTLGAGFRAAINFVPRPITQPAWYHSKEAFYCFVFVVELLVVYVYAIARFDRRFHVPDGSSGPGDYSGVNTKREDNSAPESATAGSREKERDDDHGCAEV